MNTLDNICQDIKELFVNSDGQLNNSALGFDQIAEKSKHSKSTIGLHLKDHLLKTGLMTRDFDRKYTWNESQKFSYMPTIEHTLYKFELTIKPKISLSTTTLEFQNHISNPLKSYCWYFTSIVPVTWKKLSPEITLTYNDKEHPLSNKIVFLEPNNPYHHKFRIEFPFSLLKDKPATLIFKNKRYYKMDHGFIPLFPEETTQQIEFVLNCPTSNYQLQVLHINKKTGQPQDSPHVPIKNGNTISWKNTSHNLEEYYLFDWKKVKKV